jgi:hypothetical protein
LAAYLIPIYFFWLGSRLLLGKKSTHPAYDQLYFSILTGSLCFLLTTLAESHPEKAAIFGERVITESIVIYTPYPQTIVRHNLGGIPFYFLYADLPMANLMRILSPIGTTLIFSCLGLVSCLLLTRIRIVLKLKQMASILQALTLWLKNGCRKKLAHSKNARSHLHRAPN